MPNIIPEFNTRFKTFTQYRNYRQQHLNDWLNNANFKVFDGAYCHHCLLLQQKEGLQTLIKQINAQLKELDEQDQCQLHNIHIIIPNLQAKGLAVHITDTLGRPDIVGEPPFSYPVSLWKHPRPTQPFTPIQPPTLALPIPEPKKKQRYGEKCPKCKREYLYNHVAWARGYKSGYTCRCPEEEAPSMLCIIFVKFFLPIIPTFRFRSWRYFISYSTCYTFRIYTYFQFQVFFLMFPTFTCAPIHPSTCFHFSFHMLWLRSWPFPSYYDILYFYVLSSLRSRFIPRQYINRCILVVVLQFVNWRWFPSSHIFSLSLLYLLKALFTLSSFSSSSGNYIITKTNLRPSDLMSRLVTKF